MFSIRHWKNVRKTVTDWPVGRRLPRQLGNESSNLGRGGVDAARVAAKWAALQNHKFHTVGTQAGQLHGQFGGTSAAYAAASDGGGVRQGDSTCRRPFDV